MQQAAVQTVRRGARVIVIAVLAALPTLILTSPALADSPPGAPSGVMASPASGQALVSWTAPADSGSPISSYTVTPYDGATAGTAVIVNNGAATSATVSGLTNGTSYTFTVTASNGAGVGPASPASTAVTPEDTLFDFSGSPAIVDSADTSATEVGVKFTADSAGSVTGIRFYKAAANVGTHIGSLWTSDGTLLASATFTNETASGWQTVTFASPVAVTAGTTYVAAYYAPDGHYSATPNGLGSPVDNAPLHAVGNGTSPNGVYAYTGASSFPTNSYNANNYWVDVLFQPSASGGPSVPSAPTSVTASPASSAAMVSWSVPSANGSAISSYTITPYANGTAAGSSVVVNNPSATSAVVTGLSNGTAYTFTVTATNGIGAGPASSASAAVTPQDTIFDFSAPSSSDVDSGDNSSAELGVKFTADSSGSITGIRFYKAAANTGAHVGSLWTAGGTLLASATFTDETGSGWQTVSFASPVPVTAGSTYVAGYFAPNGHYSGTPGALSSGYDNAPLHAVSNGTSANGVYSYGSVSAFPTSSYGAANYWVDVLFAPSGGSGGGGPSAPNPPGNVTAKPASSQALVTWTDPNSNGSPISSYTITPYANGIAGSSVTVNGGTATSAVVSGLTNGTAYTFTVTATNGVGAGNASAQSAAVTPEDTLFDFSSSPAKPDSGDSSSVEVGTKFTADTDGTVTGIRFYKAATNTGTHVGSLWTSTGTLLASATFTNETATGWQTVTFPDPVPITAGTTYVAAYLAPNGHYSATTNGLLSAVDNPPLHAVASGTSANGVYSYATATTFPTSSYQANNYWVDVLFAPAAGTGGGPYAPAAPSNVAASPASSQALVSWTPPSANGSPITSYTITPYVAGQASTPVTVNNGSATSAVVTGLTNGTAYTFTVAATNAVGAGAASGQTTAVTPEDTIFDFNAPPSGSVDSGDGSSVTVGVKFTADDAGLITGLRFYKSAANTGTHIGSLWAADGTLLASATFTNESGSGWQTVTFANPVAITAGTTYVAGYFAPNGHYSATTNGFSSSVDNPPLHAISAGTSVNGVYAYSPASIFPTRSYEANNYWVDVLFQPITAVPGQATNVSATALPEGAAVSWTAPSSGGQVGSYTITPYTGSTAWTPTTVAGNVTSTHISGLIPDESYTFVVQASNAVGNGPASATSNAVTPTAGSAPSAPTDVTADPATNQAQVSWTPPANNGGSAISGYTVTPYIGSQAQTPVQVDDGSATAATVKNLTNGTTYTFTVTATNNDGTSSASAPSNAVTPDFTIFDFTTPSNPDAGDTSSLELGVKFTADANGSISGIRFYKSAANTGTHIGSLWTANGTLLASATFSNETASGWQTVMFANPVEITAGTTYVAAYFDPNGHYAATTDGLASAVDNAPLHAISNSTSPNGVYASSGQSTFPSNSYQANNYWVDVVFSPSAASSVPGQPQGVSATPAWQSATVSWSAPWDGGSTITQYTITPYIGSQPQASTTVSGTTTTATIGNLTNGTSYTFKVAATNANGTGGASAASSAVTPGPEPSGAWSPLLNWPLVAIHANLLYTGNVLVWDGWQQPEPSQEWNPATGTFTNAISSPDSIFCSAMTQMPDGRILVAGGYGELSTGNLGIVDTDIYDPATGTWTRVADMHYPRWYESMTELANGEDVVVSGKTTDFNTWADTPEVYDPTSNTWTLLSNVNTSQIHELEYPNSYLLPNGNVFVLGPQEDKSFELNVPNQTWTQVGGSSGVVNGGSVMYQPGKILYAGGAASLSSPSAATANAAVIDTTSADPQWTPVSSMNYPRAFENLQMLADGTVLVVGGEPQTGVAGGEGEVSGGVLPAEIWDPSTEKFTTVASMAATRGYHTSTMLLPDGRVLVSGSGHASPGEPGQYSAQIYSPPYLFSGTRPTISSAPASATYGSNITISTPDAASIKAVNLVDLGTSTHQMDFSQHFVPLSFTAGAGSLDVQMPSSGNYAPPGYYMLFIVSDSGVPSVASFINVASSAQGAMLARGGSARTPATPSGVTARAISATAARVSWKVPADHGHPITSYTITPYKGTTPLKPTKVRGTPAPTGATVSGLRTGTRYTFTVAASNAAGTGLASKRSNAITPTARPRPAFIQQASAYADTSRHVTLKLAAPVIVNDRLVVETSVWGRGADTMSVTDSAGNVYTEVLSGIAPDGTHTSVWTATLRGADTVPLITVNASEPADIGAVAVEYSGLSTAAGAGAIDQISAAGGVTRHNMMVSSPATPATAEAGELAVGIYADSGFGDTLKAGRGYRARIAVARTRTMMEQLIEDRIVGYRARPAAAVDTGAQTAWMMATIVFRRVGTASDGRSTARRLPRIRLPKAPPPGAGGGPLIPLSERPRPHPVAGAIAEFEGRLPNGQIVHYYCLVAPGGTVDDRLTLASAFSWMPANIKPLK